MLMIAAAELHHSIVHVRPLADLIMGARGVHYVIQGCSGAGVAFVGSLARLFDLPDNLVVELNDEEANQAFELLDRTELIPITL